MIQFIETTIREFESEEQYQKYFKRWKKKHAYGDDFFEVYGRRANAAQKLEEDGPAMAMTMIEKKLDDKPKEESRLILPR